MAQTRANVRTISTYPAAGHAAAGQRVGALRGVLAARRRGFFARWSICATWALLLLSLGSCAAKPATNEQTQLAERQLLMPYLQDRLVVCSELTIDITPNFHLNVSNPGVDERKQRFERIEGVAQVEKVWSNLTGGESGWFSVTISEPLDPIDVAAKRGPHTTFKVMSQLRIVVHERAQMQLSARAEGPFVAVQEANAEAREVRSFAIVDGVLER